ncbi:MAG: enoyl-CoA hydratase/isomerase family protein [Thermoplasmata archaeon]|nr:enoyl-CoA hydratase/isomerase family protein [Candidatus Sysuiplasma acidicola]MBX8646418.1 enoyl-CoA hydratase/isomerase family protein [Candidatus Sysuiplasma acidicola]MDH2906350.1 enoyl-CoA hydratase-related protein [Methanomassiliicoccales archaeon]
MINVEFANIRYRTEDGIASITLDRPPANALSTAMIGEIGAAVEIASSDDSGALIITGAGQFFAAGADVKEMAGIRAEDIEQVVKQGQETFQRIAECPKPTIAAVNGMAIGGGNELAMACDFRIAADSARFGQPEVNLGLIPAYGGTQRMTRLIGASKAKELILTGNMISAQEALKIGLVNRVVPGGEEMRAARDIAHTILQRAPLAVRASKAAIDRGAALSLREGLEQERKEFMTVARSEDLREGIEAFVGKRQPKFRGK